MGSILESGDKRKEELTISQLSLHSSWSHIKLKTLVGRFSFLLRFLFIHSFLSLSISVIHSPSSSIPSSPASPTLLFFSVLPFTTTDSLSVHQKEIRVISYLTITSGSFVGEFRLLSNKISTSVCLSVLSPSWQRLRSPLEWRGITKICNPVGAWKLILWHASTWSASSSYLLSFDFFFKFFKL